MKRHLSLVRLSWDHHHGLVMALRIARELPDADDAGVARLTADLVAFWSAGLLPHFQAEEGCLLSRLALAGRSAESVLRTRTDHDAIRELAAVAKAASSTNARRAVLAEVGDSLRTHIRWEEAVLFNEAQTELTESELAAMAAEIDLALGPVAAAPGSG